MTQSVVHLRTVVPASGPWIFRKMVRDASPRTEPGAVVRVVDRDGGFVAQAFWNPKSELALRVLTRDERPVDDEWLRRAVRRAIALRRDALQLDRVSDAWRVVFSEADDLPGLVVDRFAHVLSCQVSTLGIYRAFPVIADELKRELGATVLHVSADPKIAKIEGFPMPQSAGESARVTIRENGLSYDVDCAEGHKTGFFLDQRESRRRVRDLAKGRRVLDLCSYTGGFALSAAKGDAASVTAVDLDEAAIAQAERNAKRNGVSTIEHRVADWTSWTDRERYDLVIGSDILYTDLLHPFLRHIFETNLRPGGVVVLSDPFREESMALFEMLEADGWRVAMDKWTVGIAPPPRPIGVFALTPA